MSAESEHLVNVISGIRKPGVSSITYWSIVLSNKSLYFCKLSSNSLPGVYGAIKDSYSLHSSRKSGQTINNILDGSEIYYIIKKSSLNDELTHTKTLLGGKVSINVENNKNLTLKLNSKQYNQLLKFI